MFSLELPHRGNSNEYTQYNVKVCCVFSLELPHRGDSNEYTQYTFFKIKKEKNPELSQVCNYGVLFLGSQERVQNSRGKRAISVPVIEVLLYTVFCFVSVHYSRCHSLDVAGAYNYSRVILVIGDTQRLYRVIQCVSCGARCVYEGQHKVLCPFQLYFITILPSTRYD